LPKILKIFDLSKPKNAFSPLFYIFDAPTPFIDTPNCKTDSDSVGRSQKAMARAPKTRFWDEQMRILSWNKILLEKTLDLFQKNLDLFQKTLDFFQKTLDFFSTRSNLFFGRVKMIFSATTDRLSRIFS
jgi:hypothetical protein